MAYSFTFLNSNITVDDTWKPFFLSVRNELNSIEKNISGDTIKPKTIDIFKVFTEPLNGIKVIILGLDPYPKNNDATGLAFEVNCYNIWAPTRNSSINGFLKALYRAKYGKTESISVVRKKIKNGVFKIDNPNILFKNWANNGVFLLNTALTCKEGKAKSHIDYWKPFTQNLLNYISKNQSNIKYLLFGKTAQKFEASISAPSKDIIKHSHPRHNTFVKGNPFEKVHKLLL